MHAAAARYALTQDAWFPGRPAVRSAAAEGLRHYTLNRPAREPVNGATDLPLRPVLEHFHALIKRRLTADGMPHERVDEVAVHVLVPPLAVPRKRL